MKDKPTELDIKRILKTEDYSPTSLLKLMDNEDFDEILIVGLKYRKEGNPSYKTAWSKLKDTHRIIGILTEMIQDLLNDINYDEK